MPSPLSNQPFEKIKRGAILVMHLFFVVVLFGADIAVERFLERLPVLESHQQRQMVEGLSVGFPEDLLLDCLQQLFKGLTFLFHIIL